MGKSIVCTVCSREKAAASGALPAHERYLGSHVRHVHALAQGEKSPFFILSGLHGLLEASAPTLPYDFLLTQSGVAKLAKMLEEQMRRLGVVSVRFYCKNKESWLPYRRALMLACQKAGVIVRIAVLPENT